MGRSWSFEKRKGVRGARKLFEGGREGSYREGGRLP